MRRKQTKKANEATDLDGEFFTWVFINFCRVFDDVPSSLVEKSVRLAGYNTFIKKPDPNKERAVKIKARGKTFLAWSSILELHHKIQSSTTKKFDFENKQPVNEDLLVVARDGIRSMMIGIAIKPGLRTALKFIL